MRSKVRGFLSVTMSGLLLGGPLSGVSRAVDGVKLFGQNNALAGNVTPGDAPGFPVTISRPGSYRLSSNLTVPDENTTAIEITADNVTLDLNGFSVLGPTECGGVPIACAPRGMGRGVDGESTSNTTVVNGTVRGMGSSGLYLGDGSRVEKVSAMHNGEGGILVVGVGSLVSGNIASDNLGPGIFAGFGVTVSGNTVLRNSVGVSAESGIISGNTIILNEGFAMQLGDHTGYTHNRLSGVWTGGTSLGQNVCDFIVC